MKDICSLEAEEEKKEIENATAERAPQENNQLEEASIRKSEFCQFNTALGNTARHCNWNAQDKNVCKSCSTCAWKQRSPRKATTIEKAIMLSSSTDLTIKRAACRYDECGFLDYTYMQF